jgi:tetratricopeptide (TPR) repeat protein
VLVEEATVNGGIELEIGAGSGPGDYRVRVLQAAAGGEPVGSLRIDVDDLLSRRSQLEATVLASAVPARRTVPVAEQPVRQVGRQLFEALFTGSVYGTYRASLGVAQQQGKRLRVVLRLTAPELAALPWEMLFDPETETYLCRQEPLVRHVPAPYTPDPLAVRPPLRVLALVASPRGLPLLDVDAEKQHLTEALAQPVAAGLVELVWVPEASWDGIHSQLLSGEWHILHFVGHGDYDVRTDEGLIALVGADGRADLVEAGRLATLLGDAEPTPRLVVLNSCSSGETGMQDLFSGTAAALVRSGISAVAAMQFTVSDAAAIAFARGFYTAVAHGRRVDEAARSGRISILGTPGTLEWVTPVLYLRGEATRLFAFTAAPIPPPDELRALYSEARAELRLEHFDTAIELFDDLLTLDPHYRDAAALRDAARRGRQLADSYMSAREAEDAGDWATAARAYDEILQAEPAYRDAAARRAACETRQQVSDLQAELRHHAAAGNWQAVLDVDAELTRMDRSAADPDGLATRAREALDAAQRAADLERRYTQARAAEDAGDWAAAAQGYDEILAIAPTFRDALATVVGDRVDRAEALFRRREYVQALSVCAEILQEFGNSADPALLAYIQRARELSQQAKKQLFRRRWRRWSLMAIAPAVAIGIFLGWRLDGTTTVPGGLEEVAADFGPAYDTPRHFTLNTLEKGFDKDTVTRLRSTLESKGFQRGFRRTAGSTSDKLRGVLIMQFESPAAAKEALPKIGTCWESPDKFNIPSVPEAMGQRCKDMDGTPVQEVSFTRGRLLFKVKLQFFKKKPQSTAEIVEMAHAQAEKAR